MTEIRLYRRAVLKCPYAPRRKINIGTDGQNIYMMSTPGGKNSGNTIVITMYTSASCFTERVVIFKHDYRAFGVCEKICYKLIDDVPFIVVMMTPREIWNGETYVIRKGVIVGRSKWVHGFMLDRSPFDRCIGYYSYDKPISCIHYIDDEYKINNRPVTTSSYARIIASDRYLFESVPRQTVCRINKETGERTNVNSEPGYFSIRISQDRQILKCGRSSGTEFIDCESLQILDSPIRMTGSNVKGRMGDFVVYSIRSKHLIIGRGKQLCVPRGNGITVNRRGHLSRYYKYLPIGNGAICYYKMSKGIVKCYLYDAVWRWQDLAIQDCDVQRFVIAAVIAFRRVCPYMPRDVIRLIIRIVMEN